MVLLFFTSSPLEVTTYPKNGRGLPVDSGRRVLSSLDFSPIRVGQR